MLDQRTTAIRVATDVGGTFTDLVYFATDPATGRQVVRTAKVDTTPPDYETGRPRRAGQGRASMPPTSPSSPTARRSSSTR